jgi:hypothetical protein
VTGEQLLSALASAAAGGAIATLLAVRFLQEPREELVRTNVDGRLVPAVLGHALVLGAILGNSLVAIVWIFIPRLSFGSTRMTGAVCVALLLLFFGGIWDDFGGDEPDRGFRGHLTAARHGRVTGGLVKIAAGCLAGVAAGAILGRGWAVLEIGAIVALTANFVNLLDRAPGRAGKAGLLIGIPLALFGSPSWTVVATGLLGALIACLPFDLRGRGMLGDAGANPLGGVLGLGLAVSLAHPGRLVAIAVLLLLNLLSERISFSRVIEATPALKWVDMLGRK